jgi:hypothetical protein
MIKVVFGNNQQIEKVDKFAKAILKMTISDINCPLPVLV